MSGVAVGTIISKRYLAFARVLAESLRRHHPELPLFVLVVDPAESCFHPPAEPFEVLWLEDLGVPDLRGLRFRHLLQEVLVMAKPLLLRDLLDRGYDHALFLDADMLVMDRLDPLLAALHGGSPVLTPHLLKPPRGPDRAERELNILLSGVFNAGVIGVSDTGPGRRFLSNWGERLATHCRLAVGEGLFYDQRWLDFAPSHSESLVVMRDPAINVGHWALPERPINACRLFHFSGFEPWHPERVSKWSDRLRMNDLGPGAEVFRRYAKLLHEAGIEETRWFPYSFERFHNGVRIPDVARRMWTGTADPFADDFFHWLCEPVEGGVSRVWDAFYRSRPDLQEGFPNHLGADSAAFRAWTRTHGAAQHRIDRAFV